MIDDVLSDLSDAIEKAHAALKVALQKIRTGRANANMLDTVKVDYYGAKTPINQMANVGVPEPRLLTVKPWDKTQLGVIEKAIREADLGFNPQNDGEIIRVPVPPLSEERRKEMVKLARKFAEDHKVAIRKSRHDAMDMLTELKSSSDISEDEAERAKKKVEEVVSAGVASVDEVVAAKEKEVMTV